MKLGKKNAVIEMLTVYLDNSYFFYKQPVYKQLALGWQIAKQLSGLKSFQKATIKTTD